MEELIFIPIMLIGLLASLATLGFWVWALIDCVKHEPGDGNNKVGWIIAIALLGWLGALLYVVIRRPARIQEVQFQPKKPPYSGKAFG